jgi:hypothetical protein
VVVHPETVIAAVASGLISADRMRQTAGAPEAEYALEVEVHCPNGKRILDRFGGRAISPFGVVEPNRVRLPRLSVGGPETFSEITHWVAIDLLPTGQSIRSLGTWPNEANNWMRRAIRSFAYSQRSAAAQVRIQN